MELISIPGLSAAFCTTASFLPQSIKTIEIKRHFGYIAFRILAFCTGDSALAQLWIANRKRSCGYCQSCYFSIYAIILRYKIKYK